MPKDQEIEKPLQKNKPKLKKKYGIPINLQQRLMEKDGLLLAYEKEEGNKLPPRGVSEGTLTVKKWAGYTAKNDRRRQIDLITDFATAAATLFPHSDIQELLESDGIVDPKTLNGYNCLKSLAICFAICHLVQQTIAGGYTFRDPINADLYRVLHQQYLMLEDSPKPTPQLILKCLLELRHLTTTRIDDLDQALIQNNLPPLDRVIWEEFSIVLDVRIEKEGNKLKSNFLSQPSIERALFVADLGGKAAMMAGSGFLICIGANVIGMSTFAIGPMNVTNKVLSKGFEIGCGAQKGAIAANFLGPSYSAQIVQYSAAVITSYLLSPLLYCIGAATTGGMWIIGELLVQACKEIANSLAQLISSGSEVTISVHEFDSVDLLTGTLYCGSEEVPVKLLSIDSLASSNSKQNLLKDTPIDGPIDANKLLQLGNYSPMN